MLLSIKRRGHGPPRPKKKKKKRDKHRPHRRQQRVEGEMDLYCKLKGGHVKKITCLVSSDLKDDMLISWHNQKDLQILSPEWPELPKHLRMQDEADNRKLNTHEVGQFDKVEDKDIKSLLTELN